MRSRTPFQRIDVQRAENLLSRGDLVVFDARDVGSFEKSHVTGAQHVSSHNLSALIGATARTRPILIYCYHGNASREYAQTFSDFGFSEVYSLDGGYEAWCTRPLAGDSTVLDTELQQWLIAQQFASADVNAVIANATTPLMYAASSGKAAIVERLLAKGADTTLETPDGFSALDLAQTVECLRLLHPRRRLSAASEP